MSAAEAPKSEQIQANVAAALSRLRGELGAASSPVASVTPIPMPKTPPIGSTGGEPAVEPEPMILAPLPTTPLPVGPLRMTDIERPTTGLRPFEPTLNAAVGSTASNDSEPPLEEAPKPDLFGRMRPEPTLSAERAAASEAQSDNQPDLLSGMEVPPAPPPPLGAFAADDDEVNGRGRRMRNRLMVLLALAVIAGGAAWAWVASHRTAEGPVPVITADATPEKVKPTDEGGMQVPNQNVQILDNMNGQAAGTQQQETVLPPPEQPVAPPSTETTDQANAAPQAPAITDTPSPTPEPAPATTDQSAAPSVAAPAIPSVTAPEPGQTAAAAPVVPEPQPQQAAPAPPAAEPTPAPAATATPAAPTELAPAAPKTEPTQTAAAPTAPATPAVAPTAGGTARVQLAAVKSEALASAQWAKMQKAHPDLLGALTLNVEKVVKSDGSTLFRVQAGPLSKAQAKDLCGKLKAAKQDCLVAK
jgi:hypothetical protein